MRHIVSGRELKRSKCNVKFSTIENNQGRLLGKFGNVYFNIIGYLFGTAT